MRTFSVGGMLAALILMPAPSYCAAGRVVLAGGGHIAPEVRGRCWAGTPGKVLVVTAATKDPRQTPEPGEQSEA